MNKLWSKKFLATVVINLVPIAGVRFFGWDMFNIFFFYWLEAGLFLILAFVIGPIKYFRQGGEFLYAFFLYFFVATLFWAFSGFFISGVFGKIHNINEIDLFFRFVKENILVSYWLLIASGLNYVFSFWRTEEGKRSFWIPFEKVGLLWVFMFMIPIAFWLNSVLVYLIAFIFLRIIIESGSTLIKVLGVIIAFGFSIAAFAFVPDGRTLPAQYGLPSIKIVQVYSPKDLVKKCLEVSEEECFRLNFQSSYPDRDASKFLKAFDALKQGSTVEVAKSLPFYWNKGPEDRVLIDNEEKLQSMFDEIFYLELRQALARAILADLSIQADGISLLGGAIWLKPDGTIEAVNINGVF